MVAAIQSVTKCQRIKSRVPLDMYDLTGYASTLVHNTIRQSTILQPWEGVYTKNNSLKGKYVSVYFVYS